MAVDGRHIERLLSKHRQLEERIKGEERRLTRNESLIRRLKVEKLRIKDVVARMRGASV